MMKAIFLVFTDFNANLTWWSVSEVVSLSYEKLMNNFNELPYLLF
jgi:hypothetical protein